MRANTNEESEDVFFDEEVKVKEIKEDEENVARILYTIIPLLLHYISIYLRTYT